MSYRAGVEQEIYQYKKSEFSKKYQHSKNYPYSNKCSSIGKKEGKGGGKKEGQKEGGKKV
jgi:hypothetical protein